MCRATVLRPSLSPALAGLFFGDSRRQLERHHRGRHRYRSHLCASQHGREHFLDKRRSV